jgi:hypothetical protein
VLIADEIDGKFLPCELLALQVIGGLALRRRRS